MNDMIIKQPIPLSPPVVPLAYQDGLLKTADLQTPVAVEVKVWPAAESGYTVRLDLDGVPITEERVITDADKPGDVLTLFIAERYLQSDGTHLLQYRTFSPNADSENQSPAIPLTIDRTSPGAALLAPMIFPSASFGARATALVPGYAGIEAGDTLHTLCNGTPGPSHTVQPDELSLRPIEISFEQNYLISLGAQNVVIHYSVTDRAGNESIASLPSTLSMNL